MTPGGFLTPPVHLTEFFDLDPTPVDGCSVCKEKAEERRQALDAGFVAVAACAAVEIGRIRGIGWGPAVSPHRMRVEEIPEGGRTDSPARTRGRPRPDGRPLVFRGRDRIRTCVTGFAVRSLNRSGTRP